MQVYQFLVTGRMQPTEAHPTPKVFRMRIFARDQIVAESRFWYFMKRLQRVKKSNGEVLEISRIQENSDQVKNYGIWLRYDTRQGTTNMYKEFRDVSKEGAVSQMYAEMAGRHRAQGSSIQILKCEEIASNELRRPHMLQLQAADLKYPHIRRMPIAPKGLKKRFVASRTGTFFN